MFRSRHTDPESPGTELPLILQLLLPVPLDQVLTEVERLPLSLVSDRLDPLCRDPQLAFAFTRAKFINRDRLGTMAATTNVHVLMPPLASTDVLTGVHLTKTCPHNAAWFRTPTTPVVRRTYVTRQSPPPLHCSSEPHLPLEAEITVFTKASTTTREKSGLTAVATSADVRMPRINTTSVQRDVASTLTFLLDVHTSPIPKTLAAVSHNAV